MDTQATAPDVTRVSVEDDQEPQVTRVSAEDDQTAATPAPKAPTPAAPQPPSAPLPNFRNIHEAMSAGMDPGMVAANDEGMRRAAQNIDLNAIPEGISSKPSPTPYLDTVVPRLPEYQDRSGKRLTPGFVPPKTAPYVDEQGNLIPAPREAPSGGEVITDAVMNAASHAAAGATFGMVNQPQGTMGMPFGKKVQVGAPMEYSTPDIPLGANEAVSVILNQSRRQQEMENNLPPGSLGNSKPLRPADVDSYAKSVMVLAHQRDQLDAEGAALDRSSPMAVAGYNGKIKAFNQAVQQSQQQLQELRQAIPDTGMREVGEAGAGMAGAVLPFSRISKIVDSLTAPEMGVTSLVPAGETANAAHVAQAVEMMQTRQAIRRVVNASVSGGIYGAVEPTGPGESRLENIAAGLGAGAAFGSATEILGAWGAAMRDKAFGRALLNFHKAISDELLSRQEIITPDGRKIQVNSREMADQIAEILMKQNLPHDVTTADLKDAEGLIRKVQDARATRTEKGRPASPGSGGTPGGPPPEEGPAAAAQRGGKPKGSPPGPPEGARGLLEQEEVTRGDKVLVPDGKGQALEVTVDFAAPRAKGNWVRVIMPDGSKAKFDRTQIGKIPEQPETVDVSEPEPLWANDLDEEPTAPPKTVDAETAEEPEAANTPAVESRSETPNSPQTVDVESGDQQPQKEPEKQRAAARTAVEEGRDQKPRPEIPEAGGPIQVSTDFSLGDTVKIGDREGKVKAATKGNVNIDFGKGQVEIHPAGTVVLVQKKEKRERSAGEDTGTTDKLEDLQTGQRDVLSKHLDKATAENPEPLTQFAAFQLPSVAPGLGRTYKAGETLSPEDRSTVAVQNRALKEHVAKEYAETIKPLNDLPTRSVKSVWGGNRTQQSKYVSDGHMMVDSTLLQGKYKKTMVEPDPEAVAGRTSFTTHQRSQEVWDSYFNDESYKPATAMEGTVRHGTADFDQLYVLDTRGRVAATLDPHKYQLMQNATGFDHIEAKGPKAPVTFYKGSSPVGIIMPLHPGSVSPIHVPTAQQTLKGGANAIREPGANGVLPHPQKATGKAGSQRGRVGPGHEGDAPAQAGAPEKAAPQQDERPAGPHERQPWEMTSTEYSTDYPQTYAGGVPLGRVNTAKRDAHRGLVAKAIEEGQDVPQRVLREYPELDPQARQNAKPAPPFKAVENANRKGFGVVDANGVRWSSHTSMEKAEADRQIMEREYAPGVTDDQRVSMQTERHRAGNQKITATDLPKGWKVVGPQKEGDGWAVVAGDATITDGARTYEEAVKDAYHKRFEVDEKYLHLDEAGTPQSTEAPFALQPPPEDVGAQQYIANLPAAQQDFARDAWDVLKSADTRNAMNTVDAVDLLNDHAITADAYHIPEEAADQIAYDLLRMARQPKASKGDTITAKTPDGTIEGKVVDVHGNQHTARGYDVLTDDGEIKTVREDEARIEKQPEAEDNSAAHGAAATQSEGGRPVRAAQGEDRGPLDGAPSGNGGAVAKGKAAAAGAGPDSGGDDRGVEPAGGGRSSAGPGEGTGLSDVGAARDGREVKKADVKPKPVKNADWYSHPEDFSVEATNATRLKWNLTALRILKEVRETGRAITAEEKDALAHYVGWGALQEAFDPYSASLGEQSQWKRAYGELQKLLTEDEFARARESVKNAHYTSPQVVRWMWRLAARAGFDGGTILEPSMGTGNFFGMMPKGLRAKVNAIGNELDPSTALIARLLYPSANIYDQNFRDLIIPDDSIDLAIGNVPFGAYKLYDPRYPKLNAQIHDYFIIKSLDKVRPGGLLMYITSNGTLDKESPLIRSAILDRADLVAAFRLPSSTFEKTAGTVVVTDMLVLRKRGASHISETEPFQDVIDASTVAGADSDLQGIKINSYFGLHPEHILGSLVSRRGRYGADREMTVGPDGRSLEERLKEAQKLMPKDVMRAARAVTVAPGEMILAPEAIQEGNYTLHEGQIMQRSNGVLLPAQSVLDKEGKPSPNLVDRVGRLINLRITTLDLLDTMRSVPEGDASIEHKQQELGKLYDAYVKRHGYLNGIGTRSVFQEDPQYPLLLSLESYDRENKKGTRADIFTKRTIYPPQKLTALSKDHKEALYQVLADRGFPDLQLMSDLNGRSPEDNARELENSGLIFRDPVTGLWETKEKYLSGYVGEKLRDAEAAVRQGNKAMQRNVDALTKVMPEPVPLKHIDVNLGATYLFEDSINQFIGDVLKGGNAAKVKNVGGQWIVEGVGKSIEVNREYAAGGYDAGELLSMALNLKSPIVKKDKEVTGDDGKPKTVSEVDRQATVAAQAGMEKIQKSFAEYVTHHPEWGPRIATEYNLRYNSLVLPEYDGSHMTFPGMSRVHLHNGQLRPHQVNAVWRIIQDGRALLGHVVGAGKTYEMIAAAMELKRLGRIRKPMFVVPNHKVGDWAEDFYRLYPGARLLVPSKRDFESTNRNRLMSRIATNDWDGIILAHSQFDLMDIDPERQRLYYLREMEELEDALRAADAADRSNNKASYQRGASRGQRKSRTVKQLEKAKSNLEAKLDALKDMKADKTILFDQLGVDHLSIDEAQRYKNLAFYTKMNRVAGLSQGNSKRASRLKMKTDFLLEKYNHRGVVFATGTPVSNTMAELRHMIYFVAPDVLEKAKIRYFDDWAANFGKRMTVMELSVDSRNYKPREKFALFVNVPEMQLMFRSFADIKTKEDLDLPTPQLEGGKPISVVVPSNETVDGFMREIIERAKAIRGQDGRKVPDPRIDNMLKVTSDGRTVATDVRLMDPSLPDHPNSKINVAVSNIYEEWRKGKEATDDGPENKTQMVFLDMYRHVIEEGAVFDEDTGKKLKHGKEREVLNLYRDMVEKLARMGVPREELAIVHDYKTDARKQLLWDAVNAGRVRILFGSTQKMGEGTNAQRRLKAMHHLDAPWKPGELEQRNGRILRQGNLNKSVRIYNYGTAGSFDAYMYQTLESKGEFIHQVMSGRFKGRTMIDAASDMVLALEEMKAIFSGNPDVKTKMEIEAKLVRLESLEREHDSRRLSHLSEARSKEHEAGSLRTSAASLEEWAKKIEKASEDDKWHGRILGQDFTKLADAVAFVKGEPAPPTAFHVEIKGVQVRIAPREANDKWGLPYSYKVPWEFMEGAIDPAHAIEKASNDISAVRLRNTAGKQLKSAEDNEARAVKLREIAKAPFAEAGDLAGTLEELKAVNQRLGIDDAKAVQDQEVQAEVDDNGDEEPEEGQDDEETAYSHPNGWDLIEPQTKEQGVSFSYEPRDGAFPPILTISPDARAMMLRAIPGNNFIGRNSPATKMQVLANALENLAERPGEVDPAMKADVLALADAVWRSSEDADIGGIITIMKGAPANALREELFHSGQRQFAGATGENINEHIGHEDVLRLLEHPVGKHIINILKNNGYGQYSPAALIVEAAAKIATQQPLVMARVTPEEAADFYVEYLNAIVKKNGYQALNTLADFLTRDMMEAYDEARTALYDRQAASEAARTRAAASRGGNTQPEPGLPESATGPPQAGSSGSDPDEAEEQPEPGSPQLWEDTREDFTRFERDRQRIEQQSYNKFLEQPQANLTAERALAYKRLHRSNRHLEDAGRRHKALVAQAVREGEAVPAKVLADYPDLQERAERRTKPEAQKAQVETKAFRRWFRDSKVVNEDGSPKRVYHGAQTTFSEFSREKSSPTALYGSGFYFTEDPEIAGGLGDANPQDIEDIIRNAEWSKAGYAWQRAQFEIPGQLTKQQLHYAKRLFTSKSVQKEAHEDIGVRSMYRAGWQALQESPEAFKIWLANSGPRWMRLRIMRTEQEPRQLTTAPNILPVYLSIQNPLDMEKPIPVEEAQRIFGEEQWVTDYYPSNPDATARKYLAPADLYERAKYIGLTKEALTNNIRAVGFDGITHRGGLIIGDMEHQVWIAFEPNQIKSAIGNRGTFSPDSGDILEQIEPQPEEEREALGKFEFPDQDIQQEFDAARGLIKPSKWETVKEEIKSAVHKATRTYEHLQRGPLHEELRFRLKSLEKARNVAGDKAALRLKKILGQLTPDQYYNFSVKVILDDLLETSRDGLDVPFFEEAAELERHHQAITDFVEHDEDIQRALTERSDFWADLKGDYSAAMERIGFNLGNRLSRDNYYRHQVLMYAGSKSEPSGRSKLRTPTGRGFLKARKGSDLPINTDYLQAEHEVMAMFLYDIEKAKTIRFVDNRYNVVNQLKTQALQQNTEGIMEFFEQVSALDPNGPTAEQLYRKLNVKQAMGISLLGKLAAQGELPNGRGKNDFTELFEDLSDNYNQKQADRADLQDAYATTVGRAPRMAQESMKDLIRYAAWVLKQNEPSMAKMGAATLFKGMAEKRKYIKDTLGQDYVTWRDLVPEGYTIWQPREGQTLYMTQTIPEHVTRALFEEGVEKLGISRDQLHSVLAVGGRWREYVIPEEVAETLDNLSPDVAKTVLGRLAAPLTKAWKIWELSSPRRFLRFRMRHLSGQAEAVFVGNPGAFKELGNAVSEMYDFYHNGKASGMLQGWLDRGGSGSSLLSQEMGAINELGLFKRLYEAQQAGGPKHLAEALWQGYWKKIARGSVDFAEGVMRYAAYRHYMGQMRANPDGRPENWGASRPDEVMALTDLRDRAWKMANDLLGAYDDITVLGREMRRTLLPFYSFQEINFRRAFRFLANAGYEPGAGGGGGGEIPPNDGGRSTGAGEYENGWNAWRFGRNAGGQFARKSPFIAYRLGKVLLKMAALWAGVTAWNVLLHRSEWEELSDEDKARPVLIIGRDKNGHIIKTPRLGALSELLAWFGLDAPQREIRDWLEGRKNAGEVIVDIAKGPPNKVSEAVNPLFRMPWELAASRSFFPDVLHPRKIADRGQYLAQQLALRPEYDLLAGKPGNYGRSLWGLAFDQLDVGSTAYYDILQRKREFLQAQGKGGDADYALTPKGEALRNMKLAAHLGDQKAYEKFLTQYIENGGTLKQLGNSLRAMDPLHGLSQSQKLAFIGSLSPEDQKKYVRALEYYLHYLSPGEHAVDEKQEETEEGP